MYLSSFPPQLEISKQFHSTGEHPHMDTEFLNPTIQPQKINPVRVYYRLSHAVVVPMRLVMRSLLKAAVRNV